jgi:ferredoxin
LLENPEVQRALRAAATPDAPPAAAPPKIRRCGTCHQQLGEGHVCRLEDLPKRLQAVVLDVAEAQRGRD